MTEKKEPEFVWVDDEVAEIKCCGNDFIINIYDPSECPTCKRKWLLKQTSIIAEVKE